MFSCVLFRTCVKPEGKEEPIEVLVAERASLEVEVISNVGRGTATCKYIPDRKYKDVLAYVPSSMCVQDSRCTQQIKVTKCFIREDDPSLSHSSINSSSCTVELTDDYYSSLDKKIPTYASIKKSMRRLVSPEDLILYLGDFEANKTILVQFEYLLQLKMISPPPSSPSSHPPSSLPSPLYYIFESSVSADHFSYKLRLAMDFQVMEATLTPTSHTNLTDFSRFHQDQSKQMIHVEYEIDNLRKASESAGFCIEVTPHRHQPQPQPQPMLSLLCCSLAQTDCGPHQELGSKYDEIMMVCGNITQEQLSVVGGASMSYSLSEFVFLVDCSNSVNPFMDIIRATLITSIKSLPEGCYFNIIAFGSKFRQLFHESKEYSKSSVKNAVEFVNQFQASLGGTDILQPLKWIYKKSRKVDMPCQIFIIANVDEQVMDDPDIVNTIKKNRHHSRCHIFGITMLGISFTLCEALINGIAEASGGHGVLLQEEDRMQTKVMEVLKECLNPFLMEAAIQWKPPPGYSVVDSTPKYFGALYTNQSYLAFAFLKRTTTIPNGESGTEPLTSAATMLGRLRGHEVKLPIEAATLPSLTSVQKAELASILGCIGKWAKLRELEILRLQSISRKKRTEREEDQDPPKAKRPRLNEGTLIHNHLSPYLSMPSPNKVEEDMLKLSMDSGIPCPFTYLKSSDGGGDASARKMIQILPFMSKQAHSTPSSSRGYKKGISSNHQKKYGDARSSKQDHKSTIAALANKTISRVTSSVMTMVNVFNPVVNSSAVMDGGETIEDIEKRKGTQLNWDKSRNKIIYSSIYYQTNKDNGHVIGASSYSDDEEDDVMFSESGLDWESLPKTRTYLPIIQMQLFSGAWPVARGFSYAVRVPLREIWNLPLLNQKSENHSIATSNNKPLSPLSGPRRKYCSQDIDDESNAHFWTTALAVVCFRECFSEFEGEWELIVHKGEKWLEQNSGLCALSMSEVKAKAKELLYRRLD